MSTLPSILSRGPRPFGFDMGMEVACSLPPSAPVSLKLLAADLGLSIASLRSVLSELGEVVHVGKEQCWVDPAARRHVADAANEYWDRVWGRRLAS